MKLFREVGYLRDLNRESERGCHLLKAFNLIDDYNTGGLSEAQIGNFLNKNIEDACFKKKDVRSSGDLNYLIAQFPMWTF